MTVLGALGKLILKMIFYGAIAFVAINLGVAFRKKKDAEKNGK